MKLFEIEKIKETEDKGLEFELWYTPMFAKKIASFYSKERCTKRMVKTFLCDALQSKLNENKNLNVVK